jgi:hypothetical protein
MTVRLFEDSKYDFYIEREDGRFSLNLSVKTLVKESRKEKLLTVSSSGENEAFKGVKGKISMVFETLVTLDLEHGNMIMPDWEVSRHRYDSDMTAYFLLSDYKKNPAEKKDGDKWDGLERSIIGTLADEVLVGVKNKRVKIVAIIGF